jgi:hypothetical protein
LRDAATARHTAAVVPSGFTGIFLRPNLAIFTSESVKVS